MSVPSSDPAPDVAEVERSRDAAPRSLVVDGRFRFGTYDGPVADVDLLRRWRAPARWAHAARLKEWQAFQLGDADRFVLGAVYDAKLLGLLQIVVVETATGRLTRWEHKVPSVALSVATGLSGTRSHGSWRGLRVEVANDVPDGRLRVTASQRGDGGHSGVGRGGAGAMALHVDGRCGPGDGAHLVICHPFDDGTPLYSHKCVMAAEATLRVGAGTDAATTHEFDASSSFLILDDHKGHYPSPMAYDWVTGARVDAGGRRVAFNLTRNQVRDPEVHNENALFLGDRVHRLGAVTFERPRGVHGPWRVCDAAGRVDVTFHPEVRNEQHVGPGSRLADYYGPFGWYEGTIEPAGVGSVDVAGCYGMGEQKYIRF